MNSAIRDSARDKAFAKLSTLAFQLHDLKRDLATGSTGPITIDEQRLLIMGAEKEIKIWEFITNLVERSNLQS